MPNPLPPELHEEAERLLELLAADGYQPYCVDYIARALLRARQAGVRRGDQLRCLVNEADSDPRPGSRERLAAYVEQLKEERGDG